MRGEIMEKYFLSKDTAALVIVDVQERLAAVMKMKDAVIKNCLQLIELSKMFNIPIVATEQYPKGIGRTVEEIRNALPAYHPVEKMTFSCCDEQAFPDEIKKLGKKTIILTGMETHVCVLQTCISLLHDGFDVHLVRDAVCSRAKENWKTGIEFMRDAGAVITSTETALFQLLKVAGTEEFKTISKRIK
jgi:nicotinamidase-related amidase